MRIYIKQNTGRRFFIPAPIGLVKAVLYFGNFGVSIARKHMPDDQRIYIDNIDFRELRKGFDVLRNYKGLKMVDVKAKDGTEVTITI